MTNPTTPSTSPASYGAPGAGSPPAEKASAWEDFIDIFYQPADVYRRRIDGRFGLAFLVVTIAFAALFFATKGSMQPIMDAEFARAMENARAQNPNLTDEQLAAGRGMTETIGSIIGVVIMPVLIFFGTVFLFVVGKIFGAAFTFAQAMTIVTYAQFPRLLQSIINGVQGALLDASAMRGRHSLELGPARFMDPAATDKWIIGLMGRLDLFIIWVTVLFGVGTYVIGRTTKARAALIAAVVWAVGTLVAMWQG